jgi:hypothetical protein
MGEATRWESRERLAAMNEHGGGKGRDIYSIGALPQHGIPGDKLGLNKNGKR